jgi:hypothetical protein
VNHHSKNENAPVNSIHDVYFEHHKNKSLIFISVISFVHKVVQVQFHICVHVHALNISSILFVRLSIALGVSLHVLVHHVQVLHSQKSTIGVDEQLTPLFCHILFVHTLFVHVL